MKLCSLLLFSLSVTFVVAEAEIGEEQACAIYDEENIEQLSQYTLEVGPKLVDAGDDLVLKLTRNAGNDTGPDIEGFIVHSIKAGTSEKVGTFKER